MNIEDIIQNLHIGINTLLENESDNLRRRLNELNISTHLTYYLKPIFQHYNVDLEYNGDIDNPNDRKALDIAEKRIHEIGKRTKSSNNYRFSPDIIIHRRRTNTHNLVVIEVKKDISPLMEKEFDLIKLEHLTIDYLGNHYNYKLGVAIIFGTGENTSRYEIRYFQNGIETEEANLR